VVRGGTHGRTVYEQMVRAVGEFFPESKILDESGAVVEGELNVDLEREKEKEREKERAKDEEDGYALQRFETGLSSIVGSQNGDRPGGFVLVVDGVALEHVCAFFSIGLDVGCG
jgi:phospholipid-translocating ATPase